MRTRVLICGSLPGEASLQAQRYYAHPQNQFWHLAGAVIGDRDLPDRDYEARINGLLSAGIGLWDVIASGARSGSLDSALRDVTANPLGDLATRLPALVAVGFNGSAAARIGTPMLAARELALIALPSSSAAHARMSVAEKAERWRKLGEFLG